MSVSLPRSVVAALWVGCSDADDDWLARAAAAVTGTDEPHRTTDGAPVAAMLNTLWQQWQLGGVLMAALPVPHEPLGLAGEVGMAAMDAGECIVVTEPPGRDGLLVAIPEVVAFGSALEPGAMVTWSLLPGRGRIVPGTLAEARRTIAEALMVAVDALESIDVARWRPDAADDIAELAANQVPTHVADQLPYGMDPRRIDVLVRAARLEAIAELAMADDGAAVTTWAADQRLAALRHVASAARTAMTSAATFAHAR